MLRSRNIHQHNEEEVNQEDETMQQTDSEILHEGENEVTLKDNTQMTKDGRRDLENENVQSSEAIGGAKKKIRNNGNILEPTHNKHQDDSVSMNNPRRDQHSLERNRRYEEEQYQEYFRNIRNPENFHMQRTAYMDRMRKSDYTLAYEGRPNLETNRQPEANYYKIPGGHTPNMPVGNPTMYWLPRPQIDISQMPTYGDNFDESPTEFLKNMELWFEENYITNQDKLRWIKRSMKEKAKLWCDVLTTNITTYENFKERFLAKFWSKKKQMEILREELYNGQFREKDGKTMAVHFLAVLKKTREIGNLEEDELIDSIAEHFAPYIARAILALYPKTVENTLTLLENFDRLEKRRDRYSNYNNLPRQKEYTFDNEYNRRENRNDIKSEGKSRPISQEYIRNAPSHTENKIKKNNSDNRMWIQSEEKQSKGFQRNNDNSKQSENWRAEPRTNVMLRSLEEDVQEMTLMEADSPENL